ncbi:extracellular solute-binding protein [Thiomicrospira sp. R3]|uniref:extracellular solute-binding protein n=1 Tax=Thiomicrospira sp. R3 TaxID=3035472 RepID=UPI00259B1769|nr:extracellular solute-binding protein [Thiomicrospira sp. R3]WFE69612.1 extracellular solute-binding protein [Thiomicrospira sp. R3]
MKKWFALLLTSSLLGLAACSKDSPTNSDAEQQAQVEANKVVVYSSRAEHLIKPLFDKFTAETGIEVRFQTGNANALIERLRAEGSNTPADILMTVDAGNLWYAADQGLLQQLNSPIIEKNIPAHLRDPDQLWTGLSVRARTFVYHSDKIDPAQLTTYEDLADPKWKGRLCLRTSASVYNKSLVAALMHHHGEAKAAEVITGWVNNLATKPTARDVHVMDAILAGQCDVGLVNTYYYGRLEADNPNTPLKLAWANQESTGTHINISGAGIVKHASQPNNARSLIEWLSAEKAQQTFGALNREYPANPSIDNDALVAAWGEFKQDQLNLRQVGVLQQAATMLINRVGYE